jgi:hypothetical protein
VRSEDAFEIKVGCPGSLTADEGGVMAIARRESRQLQAGHIPATTVTFRNHPAWHRQ